MYLICIINGCRSFLAFGIAITFAIASLAGGNCRAAVTYDVLFEDPGTTYAALYDDLTSNIVAGGQYWTDHITSGASLQVNVVFDPSVPTATGGSLTTAFVATRGGLDIFELGATAELRTGEDPNGADPDIEITIGTDYLENELWLDPDPSSTSTMVPSDRTDAVGVFAHEIGHAIVFQGFRDWVSGELAGAFATPFDEFVISDGELFYFTGPMAVGEYGGDVPLTKESLYHVGNTAPLAGSDILHDLMNGVAGMRGMRYEISTLDLAFAADLGLEVIFPTSIAGDYNGNGQVEQGDLDLVLLHWGDTASPAPGGWTDDLPSGSIDQNELDGVLLNWGVTATQAAGSAVPEPASLWLLLSCGISFAYFTKERLRRFAR